MKRVAWIALALGIALLAFYRLALTDGVFGRGDAFAFFTPLWAARDSALRAGILPLWTPDLFMGAPLLSDPQVGVLYPPNWITVNFPAWNALKVSVLLHVTWAALGMLMLARHALGLALAPSIITAACFALGGYVGAHAEQINQLQGIAWMPWAFLALNHARRRPVRGLLGLAAVLALIALTGHTQTLFITGVGLGLWALADGLGASGSAPVRLRRTALTLGVIAAAGALALILSAAQVVPALELSGQSNRGSGFSQRAAMAFSWPLPLAARGLLPSFDGQVFGEYVAYLGVAGLGLAAWGIFASRDRRRWPWIVLVLSGLILALGLYTPIYWPLATLPGFNWFRVPARWLALFALGGSMLAGLGAQHLLYHSRKNPLRAVALTLAFLGAVMLATLRSDLLSAEVDGSAEPTLITWLAWAGAAIALLNLILLSGRTPRRILAGLCVALVAGELALAAGNMPHADLIDPEILRDPRLTAYQIRAIAPQGAGRTLSITRGYFDTYDKDALAVRFAERGMSERAIRHGLAAAKSMEVLAANLPLMQGVPSIDGFGGGLLPTMHYAAYAALLLPPGDARMQDGRLREYLATDECLGACIPDARYLALAGVEYLALDKVYDRFYDDVQFDVGLPLTLRAEQADRIRVMPAMSGDQVHVLTVGNPEALTVAVNGQPLDLLSTREVDDGLTLAVYTLESPVRPRSIDFSAGSDLIVRAMSWVDSRTGDFSLMALGTWERMLSSDIKVYHSTEAPPRVRFYPTAQTALDNWNGTESALATMRHPDFDPTSDVIVHGLAESDIPQGGAGSAQITLDSDTELLLAVDAPDGGVLLLADAYLPGWRAEIDGQPADIYRADVMFRAVVVPPGAQSARFVYDPPWLAPLLALSGLGWALLGLAGLVVLRLNPTTAKQQLNGRPSA